MPARMGSTRPEWTPSDAGSEFACHILPGVDESAAEKQAPFPDGLRRPVRLSVDEYVEGILSGSRMILSKAITLIESNAPKHFETGQEIVQRILPHTGRAMRIGITGVPGAGKSTTIEALGSFLCEMGKKVAVLAVDPSSSISRGSILGDKTRMENLSRSPNAFIRPSPSGRTLGGVTRKSRETLLLCEAAGYEVIIVETVGVGQSEVAVRAMVDFFLLLVLTGAGDDLQGIKKGILELADSIWVNKADGNNRQRALGVRSEYDHILHHIRPATEGWRTRAYVCSALTGEGIEDIWRVVEEFRQNVTDSGFIKERRRLQTLEWIRSMTMEFIQNKIAGNAELAGWTAKVEREVITETLAPTLAARKIIERMEAVLFR
ncbi:MAG: methylmalonyl Co-A mutase-associated GTPase MeaB [Aminobacteriaceae bacterium]